ncbi:MAG TPA: permease [Sandaracinaceae bacterium LLY-WYZ-13_1]|nr:permease [Sandaracinaceae bacterium LLY-WYZ-13_1]
MLLPLTIAAGSVVAGALLGLGGQRRSISALATFALVSALVVVLAQLLPDALAALGLIALAVFAAGAVVPTLLEKLAARRGAAHADRWGLELGYGALLVHKLADGVGLGTYGGEHHAGHGHFDVLFAIAAHTVPMVALVTIAFARAVGTRSAVRRAAGLAAATVLGVLVPNLVPTALFEAVEPWVTAAVAGLLLHVLAHDWLPGAAPRRGWARVADLLAVAAAFGLVLASGHDHHGGSDVRARVGASLLDLSLETAPALLAGLVLGALLSAWGSRLPSRWLRTGGPLGQAMRGAVVGAPLPICACGVLPLASSLKRRGAGAALVVAFLLATPELGLETFALTGQLVGWPFAVVRLVAAVALAVVAALVVHRVAGRRGAAFDGTIVTSDDDRPFAVRFVESFDELVHHVAPWTVVGLVAAALVASVLSPAGLADLRPFGLDVLAVTLVAVPSYVCAASATPLAAVLLAHGMSPGAVLVGLLLGPATNLATLGFLRATYGMRATVAAVVALVVGAWAMAAGLNLWGELPVTASAAAVAEHEHGAVALGAAVLLALVLARSIWQAGLRGWLGTLSEAVGGHGHDHAHHPHAHHPHAHCHDDTCR